MAYLATTATDRFALFTAIANFASANGWTVNWNLTTNNGQLGLSKGTTFVALGARQTTPSISRQMLLTGGTVNDVPILGTLASSFSGTQTVWGNHPGAPGTNNATSTLHVWTNDWEGPFTNVFLFTNATGDYIHVIAQIGARYSMLSFGLLDNSGLTTNRSSYLTGTWYEFWENIANPASVNFGPNKPGKTGSFGGTSGTSSSLNIGHHFMFLGRGNGNSGLNDANTHIRPGASVVNTALFSGANNPVIWNGTKPLVSFYDTRNQTESWVRYLQMNMFNALPTTIGLPLMDLPAVAPQSAVPSMFFGAYPDVRAVWMEDLAPGQELDVNGNIWKVFPCKQKGNEDAVNVSPAINTWGYGLAFRKIE
jgi:hypothetical protein